MIFDAISKIDERNDAQQKRFYSVIIIRLIIVRPVLREISQTRVVNN